MIHGFDKVDGSARSKNIGRPPIRCPFLPPPTDGAAIPIEPVVSLSSEEASSGQNEEVSLDDATPPASFSGSYKPSLSQFVVPAKFPEPKIKTEVIYVISNLACIY